MGPATAEIYPLSLHDALPICRRHAVVCIVAVALGILPVDVEIDEPWGDDETAHVEGLARGERLRCDGSDAIAPDGDVAHGVELRLGVEHAPAREDDIVRLVPFQLFENSRRTGVAVTNRAHSENRCEGAGARHPSADHAAILAASGALCMGRGAAAAPTALHW